MCSAEMDSFTLVSPQRATLQILPCTVSQLLSAPQVSNDTFAICDWELNQVWEAVLHECVSLFSYAQGGGMDLCYESGDNGHDNIKKKTSQLTAEGQWHGQSYSLIYLETKKWLS